MPFSVQWWCACTAFLCPEPEGGVALEKNETEFQLTEPEKRVIQEMRRLQYGELRVVLRNGRPVQLEVSRSEKLDTK